MAAQNMEQAQASLDRRISQWQRRTLDGKPSYSQNVRDELNEYRLEVFGAKVEFPKHIKPEGSQRVIF
jgi:hypothetical protein